MVAEAAPRTDTGMSRDPEHEFICVQGDMVVARVEADCAVCAWQRRPRYLGGVTLYAPVKMPIEDDEECTIQKRRRRSE